MPGRRHGHRLAQRERLDRREDGRRPAAHLRARRDGPAEGHRARRRSSTRAAAAPTSSCEDFARALHRRPDQPAEAEARRSRSSPPAATARPAPSRRRCWRRSAARSSRSTPSSTTPSRATIPNPEDMKMLHAIARRGAARPAPTVGLGFDGDGDRCGVVDNEGEEIFADKVGVMLARDLSALHPGRDLRRRREVDRPVHDRPGAASRTASRPTTGRPAIPTSSAASTS